MKNYNKILEAINRGIQLALDDFDDEEQVQNIKSKQIQNRDYTKEYLDLLKYEVVDLGLPSGTFWCRYNLGVNPNQLTKPEDWYGDYYAWGEIEQKPIYTWKNYIYHIKSRRKNLHNFNKYNYQDNLNQLRLEDDAAYQNKKYYNFKFHIPNDELINELLKYTKQENAVDYQNIRGLNGKIFISTINGNSLFIPYNGRYDGILYDTEKYSESKAGHIWTANKENNLDSYGHYLYIDNDDCNLYSTYRYAGLAIRPVINL